MQFFKKKGSKLRRSVFLRYKGATIAKLLYVQTPLCDVDWLSQLRVMSSLGIDSTSVADPVHFFRIRIRGSGFLNTDPDPDDPKKAGSDQIQIRIRILLRYVLVV